MQFPVFPDTHRQQILVLTVDQSDMKGAFFLLNDVAMRKYDLINRIFSPVIRHFSE